MTRWQVAFAVLAAVGMAACVATDAAAPIDAMSIVELSGLALVVVWLLNLVRVVRAASTEHEGPEQVGRARPSPGCEARLIPARH